MGLAIVVELSPLEGDQLNIPYPVPESVTLLPEHTEASGPALSFPAARARTHEVFSPRLDLRLLFQL